MDTEDWTGARIDKNHRQSNPNHLAFLLGSFLNPAKYHTVQYLDGIFFVLQQNLDIKPHVRKLLQGCTALNTPKSYKTGRGFW